jgi:GH18 family chitinase
MMIYICWDYFMDTKIVAGILIVFFFLMGGCSSILPSGDLSGEGSEEVGAGKEFRIIGYVTDAVVVDTIRFDKLTHINYAFLIPRSDGTLERMSNLWKLEQIIERAHEKEVKVLISVGGWGWDDQFEALAENQETRQVFTSELITFVEQNGLDGIDIDWEYPDPGRSAENYLLLIRELRAVLPEDKLLTCAVIAHGDEYGQGIIEEVFPFFDFVNVMTYDGDNHATFEQYLAGLNYWSARGLPSEKIVLGIPFYAHPNGTPYRKIVQAYPEAAFEDEYNYYGLHLAYNGISAVSDKTLLAMEKAGGVMFWTLEQDTQDELSLLDAIYETVHAE